MTRLGSARDAIARAKAAGCAQILVGLSGGKDSLVTLDLCVLAFGAENVECYYMYLVEGMRCVEDHVDSAARRYGVKVHKLPHFSLGDLFRDGVLMPPRRDAHKFRAMKFIDTETYARDLSGIEWVAYGHRMIDSLDRRAMLHKFTGVNTKQHRLYPLWEWVPKDVISYLKAKGIRLPEQLGATTNVSGVDLRPDTLRQIRDHYPEDFARLLEIFPYAEASIMTGDIREEKRLEEEARSALGDVDVVGDAAPGEGGAVPSAPDSTQGHQSGPVQPANVDEAGR